MQAFTEAIIGAAPLGGAVSITGRRIFQQTAKLKFIAKADI
jgi:hypothetical protein